MSNVDEPGGRTRSRVYEPLPDSAQQVCTSANAQAGGTAVAAIVITRKIVEF